MSKIEENQLLLPNGKLITFNNEQFEGIKKINYWLKNGSNFFTLGGYAGSGKTTIVKKILDTYRKGVVVSAPTHKAKKVIINTTNCNGQTLHSLLGLRPDVSLDDFNPNNPQFNPIALPRITDYNLVLIDEASMVNLELFNLIKEKVNKTNTRVLYMGDPAQIPPVGEKESVVFSSTDIESHWLKTIERQANGNPLMEIYTDIRNNLNEQDGGIKRITNINANGEGAYFTIKKPEFRRLILEKFTSDEFKKDTDYTKVIAWKNDTVRAANKIIRDELFNPNSDIVEVGDLLMGYRTITNEKLTYNIIENSADYRVVEKSKLKENQSGILGYQVKLQEDLGRGKYKYDVVFIVDSTKHSNLYLYADMHDFYRDMGKKDKKNWKKYYEFRRNNLIMVNIDKYRNGLFRESANIITKDMDYGNAITTHKCQGSTYNNVFVMENDINDNWLVKERNQIKYVALTRPTTRATILTTKLD